MLTVVIADRFSRMPLERHTAADRKDAVAVVTQALKQWMAEDDRIVWGHRGEPVTLPTLAFIQMSDGEVCDIFGEIL